MSTTRLNGLTSKEQFWHEPIQQARASNQTYVLPAVTQTEGEEDKDLIYTQITDREREDVYETAAVIAVGHVGMIWVGVEPQEETANLPDTEMDFSVFFFP